MYDEHTVDETNEHLNGFRRQFKLWRQAQLLLSASTKGLCQQRKRKTCRRANT